MFQTFVELALILIIFATHDLSIYLGFTARQHNTENQITSKHILPLISQKESNIHKKIKKRTRIKNKRLVQTMRHTFKYHNGVALTCTNKVLYPKNFTTDNVAHFPTLIFAHLQCQLKTRNCLHLFFRIPLSLYKTVWMFSNFKGQT